MKKSECYKVRSEILNFPSILPFEEEDEIVIEESNVELHQPNTLTIVQEHTEQQALPELPPIPTEIAPVEIDNNIEPVTSDSHIETPASSPNNDTFSNTPSTNSESNNEYSRPKRNRQLPIHLRDGTYHLY